MKQTPALLAVAGAIALASALISPRATQAQAASQDPALTQLLIEVAAQQTVLTENHARLDEKLGLIAEDVRVGRIYVGRGGGKAK